MHYHFLETRATIYKFKKFIFIFLFLFFLLADLETFSNCIDWIYWLRHAIIVAPNKPEQPNSSKINGKSSRSNTLMWVSISFALSAIVAKGKYFLSQFRNVFTNERKKCTKINYQILGLRATWFVAAHMCTRVRSECNSFSRQRKE